MEELSVAIADYVENFHNIRPRHFSLDMFVPTEFKTINTPQLKLA